MSEIQIRRARVAEIDTLVDLWVGMMREHEQIDPHIHLSLSAADDYRSYLQIHLLDANALVLTAVEGRRNIGFTLAMVCQNLPMFEPDRYGYISDMVILPSHRSQGVGQRMFDRVCQWLRKQGIACLQLQVYSGNQRGKQFWQRVGCRDFISRMWMDL